MKKAFEILGVAGLLCVLVLGGPAIADPVLEAAPNGTSLEQVDETLEDELDTRDERDPWEGFNRKMFRFNTAVDKALFRPVARGYRTMMPDPFEAGVSNFFSNLADIPSAINHMLQGDINYMMSDLSRFMINSSIGILGLFDFASKHGLPKHGEDFGETMGIWGIPKGPYLVLPFVGPSSVRDTVGWTVEFFNFDPVATFRPIRVRNSAYALRYVERRAAFLTTTDIAEQAALDPYVFYREAYLQRRAGNIRDHALPDDF
jgi:phospholipid-binding lipoprotein MlaA